jgi:metacaspase-1
MVNRGVSLHIGLNSVDPKHYAGWSGPLTACEADADDMTSIAKLKRFSSHQLLTERATRSAVSAALGQFAKDLNEGDTLFLSYSGHGGQVPDLNDDEPDGQDETWCLYDGELLDDEIYALLGNFKTGVRILVLSDSCHSGSVLKTSFTSALRTSGAMTFMNFGKQVATREMPADVALNVYRKNKEFYDRLQTPELKNAQKSVKASALLISGCQDNQLSSDGTFNGLFTGMLLRVWKRGDFKGNYHALHKAIKKLMPPVQTPNYFRVGTPSPAFEAQTPFSL